MKLVGIAERAQSSNYLIKVKKAIKWPKRDQIGQMSHTVHRPQHNNQEI